MWNSLSGENRAELWQICGSQRTEKTRHHLSPDAALERRHANTAKNVALRIQKYHRDNQTLLSPATRASRAGFANRGRGFRLFIGQH